MMELDQHIFTIIAWEGGLEAAKSLSLLSRKHWGWCNDQFWETSIRVLVHKRNSNMLPIAQFIIGSKPTYMSMLVLYRKLLSIELRANINHDAIWMINRYRLHTLLYQTLVNSSSVFYLNSVIVQCTIQGQIDAAAYLFDITIPMRAAHKLTYGHAPNYYDWHAHEVCLKYAERGTNFVEGGFTTYRDELINSEYHIVDRIIAALVDTKQYDHYEWAMGLYKSGVYKCRFKEDAIIWKILEHIADDTDSRSRALTVFLYERESTSTRNKRLHYQFIKKIEKQPDFPMLRPLLEPVGRYRRVRRWCGSKSDTICMIIMVALLVILIGGFAVGIPFMIKGLKVNR